MRGDKGKRGEGERDRGESVGDRGRIVRILERHGDGRRGDTVVGLSWTWRAGEGEREGERERGERKRGGEGSESQERSPPDLVFSELGGRSHGFYKAFSLVRYSESALARARFVRPAERRLRGRVKKTCFCSFEIGRSKLASLRPASSHRRRRRVGAY